MPDPFTFIDGPAVTTPGCKCGDRCDFPCWQRIGLTDRRCCSACPPLPSLEEINSELEEGTNSRV